MALDKGALEAKAKEAQKKAGLTDAEMKTLQDAVNATWGVIGDDVSGKNGTVSRDEVIDIVLDASYIQNYGFDGSRRKLYTGKIKNLLQRSDPDSSDLLRDIISPLFLSARYEVGGEEE